MPHPAGELLRQQLASGPVAVRLTGTSMLPSIPPNSEVRLEVVERPAVGQVLCYASPTGTLVFHRFLGYDQDGRLLLRGDWRWRLDPPVEPVDLVGRVTQGGRPLANRLLALAAHPQRWLLPDRSSLLERGYQIVLGAGRLLRGIWWSSQARGARLEVVRPDWEAELVARLAGPRPARLRALEDPIRWAAYVGYRHEQPCACLVFHLDRSGCSLEALGCQDRPLARWLLEVFHFRLFGIRPGTILARRKELVEQWSPDQLDWLLSSGFAPGHDGLRRALT